MEQNLFASGWQFVQEQRVLVLSLCSFALSFAVLVLWFWAYRLHMERRTPAGRLVIVNPRDQGSQDREETRPGGATAIGLSTGIFFNRNIFETLPQVREAGFEHVEIWSNPLKREEYVHFNWQQEQQVRALSVFLRSLGLKVHSLHAPFSDTLNISDPDEKLRQTAVRETVRAMEVLKYLGGEYIVLHPSSTGDYPTHRYHRFSQCRRSIEELVPRAADVGVKVAVENQLPHILGGDVSTLLALTEGLPEETCGFCFDTSHAHLYPGRRVAESFEKLQPRVMTLHVSDNYGERDDHFMPGDGRVDWDAFLSALRRTGYRGAFMLEFSHESLQRQHNGDLRAAYDRARQMLHPAAERKELAAGAMLTG